MAGQELVSDARNAQALEMQQALFSQIIPDKLRAPLPPLLREPQALTRKTYLVYNQFLRNYTQSQDAETPLPSLIGFGKEF